MTEQFLQILRRHSKVLVKFHLIQLKLLDRRLELTLAFYLFIISLSRVSRGAFAELKKIKKDDGIVKKCFFDIKSSKNKSISKKKKYKHKKTTNQNLQL